MADKLFTPVPVEEPKKTGILNTIRGFFSSSNKVPKSEQQPFIVKQAISQGVVPMKFGLPISEPLSEPFNALRSEKDKKQEKAWDDAKKSKTQFTPTNALMTVDPSAIELEKQKLKQQENQIYKFIVDRDSNIARANIMKDRPEYQAEYENIKTALEKSDKDIQKGVEIYKQQYEKIDNLSKMSEQYRLINDPISSYFTTPEKRNSFISNVVAPLGYDNDGASTILTPEDKLGQSVAKSAQSEAISQFVDRKIKYDVKLGKYSKIEDGLEDQQFSNKVKNLGTTIRDVVSKNYSEVLNEDGTVNDEKVRILLSTSESVKNAAKDVNDYIRQGETEGTKALWKDKSLFGDNTDDMSFVNRLFVTAFDLPYSYIKRLGQKRQDQANFNAREKNIEEGKSVEEIYKERDTGFEKFLKPMQKELVAPPKIAQEIIQKASGDERFMDMVNGFLEEDPIGTIAFIPSLMFGIGEGAILSKIPKLAKGIRAIETVEDLAKFSKYKWGAKGVEIGEQMLRGTLLDTIIDTNTEEPMPLVNSFFNGIGGVFAGNILSPIDNIMKEVLSQKTPEESLKMLNNIGEKGKLAFTAEDLKDTKLLRAKLMTHFSENKNAIQTLFANGFAEKVDGIKNVDTAENIVKTFREATDTGTSKVGDIFENKLTEIQGNIDAYRAKPDEEIMGKIKQGFKDIFASYSDETINAVLHTKMKAAVTKEAFSEVYDDILEKTGDSDVALLTTTAAIFGKPKTVEGIIQAVERVSPEAGNVLSVSEGLVDDVVDKTNALKDFVKKVNLKNFADSTNKVAYDIQKGYDGLDDVLQGGVDYVDKISSNKRVVDNGYANFDARLYRSVNAGDIGKAQGHTGLMIKAMQEGNSEEAIKHFDELKKLIYDGMPKVVKDGMSYEDFSKMFIDYFNGDSTKKFNMLESLVNEDKGYIAEAFKDADDAFDGLFDAANLIGDVEKVDNMRNTLSVMDITRDVGGKFNTNLGELSEVQETLVNGIGVIGTDTYLEPARVAANEIKMFIDSDGKYIPDISAAYFDSDGLDLMQRIFSGVEGFGDDTMKILFEKTQSRNRGVIELLGKFFNNGVIEKEILINGNMVSLKNILSGIDVRLSYSNKVQSRIAGGMVYSNGIRLMKYLLENPENEAKLLELYASTITQYLSKNALTFDESAINGLQTLTQTDTAGDAYVALFKMVRDRFIKEGIPESQVLTMVHPMLYSVEEYLMGIANIPGGIDVKIDAIVGILVRRNSDLFSDYPDTMSKLIFMKKSDTFEINPAGNYFGNIETTKINDIFRQEFEKGDTKFKISDSMFDHYQYEIGGYFITKKRIGYGNNMSDQFTKEMEDIARLQLQAKGADEDTMTSVMKGFSDKVDDLLKYRKDGKIVDINKTIEEVVKYAKKNGIYDESLDILLDEFKTSYEKNADGILTDMYVSRMNKILNKTEEVVQEAPKFVETPLHVEARKYKSAEEFVKAQTKNEYRSAHQLNISDSITADQIDIPKLKEAIRARNGYLNNYVLSDLKKLEKLQGNPEGTITIYRASPKNELNPGDWITTDKTYANYIKQQNGGKVFSYDVKIKDLRFPNDVESLPSLQMATTFNYGPDINKFKQIREEAQQSFDQSIDDVIKTLESERELNTKLVAIEQRGKNSIIEKNIFDVSLLNNQDLKKVLSALKMDDTQAIEYLKLLGFTKEKKVGNKIITEAEDIAKTGKISDEQIYEAAQKLISEGQISFTEAVQRIPAYKKKMREIFDKQGDTIKRGQWLTLNNFGQVVVKEELGLSRFGKWFINLGTAATRDPELATDLQERATKGNKMMTNNEFKLGKAHKDISAEAYLWNARDEFYDMVTKSDISVDDLKRLVISVMDGDFLKRSNIPEKYVNIYEELWKYKKDLKNIGVHIPSDTAAKVGNTTGRDVTKNQAKKNIINRITGQRVLFSDDAMKRITKKFGYGSNFEKDIFFGGLFDKSVTKAVSGWTTQLAMFNMFGPQAVNKMIQQGINNITNAQGAVKGMMFDGKLLTELEEYFDSVANNFRLFQASTFELGRQIAKDSNKYKTFEGRGYMINNTMQKLSVLNRGDKATKAYAMKSSLVNSFYDMVEVGGIKAVDDFMGQLGDMQTFLKKYNLKEYDLFDKNRVANTVAELARGYGENLSSVWSQYDDFAKFYGKQVRDIKAKVRTNLGVFYVTDNIPELSSIRFLENKRYLFALKKRATGKFTEYGYKIVHDRRRLGTTEFVKQALSGKLPIMNQIVSEIITGLKIGRGVQRATDGEMTIGNTLEFLAIPASMWFMTIGDAMRTGWHSGRDMADIRNTALDAGADPEYIITGFAPYMAGVIEGVMGLASTAFLFQENIYSGIRKRLDTGKAIDDEGTDFDGFKAYLRYNFIRPFTNKFRTDYKGYTFYTDRDGKFETNLVEYLFNAQSKQRKDLQRAIGKQYMSLSSQRGGMRGVIKNSLSDLFPKFMGDTQASSMDQQLVIDSLKNYTKSMGFDLFTDEFALTRTADGFDTAMGNYNMVMLQDKLSGDNEFMQKVESKNILELGDDELLALAINAGALEPTTPSMFYKDIIRGLRGDLGASKAMKTATELAMPEEVSNELMQRADALRDQYESKKGKQKPEGMLNKMIEASSDLGTRYVLADYMTALNSSYSKYLKKQLGLTSPDYKIGTPIISGVRDTIPENEVTYFKEMYKFENDLVKQSRGFIGGNTDIGVSITMNAIEKDKNSPTKGAFTFQMQNVYEANWFRDNLQKEGILNDEAIDPVMMHRRSIINIINKSADYEDKEKIAMFKGVVGMFNSYIKSVDEAIPEPYTNAVARMGISYAIAPFLDEIGNYNKEGLQSMVDAMGTDKDGKKLLVNPFVSMVDSVTAATPADVTTAFEYASGMNTHPNGGGKKLPDAKIEKAKKLGSKLLDSFNAANKMAKKLGDMGYPINGVKAKYGILKGKVYEVDITPIKIEVPTLPLTQIKEVPGESQKTESLNVAERKTQMRGVLTAKYSPKAIKKSRASTSKMKF